MAQEVFKRYEKKYLLTEEQYGQLMILLGGVLEIDQYGQHRIRNLYFDTEDYQLIRTSLEKPVYKEKLRLRGYGTEFDDDTEVFAELKKKYDSVVYKRRMGLSLKEAKEYLYGGVLPSRQDQIFHELDFTRKRYGLKPMAYIAYTRMAYVCSCDPEVRVTFDRKILGRSRELDFNLGDYGVELLEPGQVLMEIKVPGAVPVWMSRTFSDLGIFPVSYSKYGTFYQKHICPKKVCQENMGQKGKDKETIYEKTGGKICA